MALVFQTIEVFSLLISLLIGSVSILLYRINRNTLFLFFGLGFIVWGSSLILTFIPDRPPEINTINILIQTFAFILILLGFFKSLGEERSRITELSEKNLMLESEISDRKKAEEIARVQMQKLEENQHLLQLSEAKFRTILNHSYEYIALVNTDGTVMEVNQSALQYSGFSKSDVVNRPLWDTPWSTHSSDLQERLRGAVRKAASGETVRFEATHSAADGHLRYIDLSIKPVYDESGNVLSLITEARDITERKQTELELRESERRMTDIINFLPDATFAIDADGIVIAWNHAIEEMTGIAAEDMLGKGNYEYAIPFYGTRRRILIDMVLEDDETISKNYSKILRKKNTLVAEADLPLPGREKRIHAFAMASPLFNRQGEIVGAIESLRDIMDRVRAEEALRESEEKFRALVETTSDFVWEVNADGVYTYVSPQVSQILGYEPEEILGKTPFDLMPQDEAERVAAVFDRCVAARLPIAALENKTYKKDGSAVILETSGVPWLAPDGTFLGYRGIDRDITTRKQAELGLRESERRMTGIINFLPDATFVIDKSGVVIAWNRAMEIMTGIPAEEMIGKGDYEYALPFYHERRPIMIDLVLHDHPDIVNKYPGIQRNGNTLISEIRIPHFHNGEGAYLWFTATPLFDANGNITGAIESIRDITQRKLAEDKLSESRSQLRSIIMGSPSPQFVIDKDHRVIFWNDALEKYSGIRAEEMVGTTRHWRAFYDRERPCMADLMVDGTIEKIPEWYENTFAKSRLIDDAYESTDFFPHMGGSGIWFYTTAAPIRDEQGDIIGAMETLSDITEERVVREALQESENKYRHILDNIQDIYYRGDQDGNLLMFSPSGYSLLGYGPDDTLLGRSIAKTLYADPNDRSKFLDAISKTGSVHDFEVNLRHKNGAVVTVATSSHFFYGPDGAIAGIEGIFRDITEKKKAEEDLKRSENLYRTVFDNTGTATILIGPDTTILRANAGWENLTGVPRQEQENLLSWTVFIHSEDVEMMKRYHHQRRIDPSKVPAVYECRLIDARSEEHNCFVYVGVIPGTKNSIASLVEITALRRATKALEQNERDYRLIIEHMQDAFLRTDMDGTILMVSPSFVEEFGYDDTKEVLGKNVADLIYADPKDRERFLKELSRTGTVKGYPLTLRRKDESIIETLISSRINYNPMGIPSGTEGIIHNITDQKKALEALNESERRFHELADLLPQVVFEADVNGTVTYANRAAFEWFRYEEEDFWKGVNVLDMIADPDRGRTLTSFREKISGQRSIYPPLEVTALRKDGTTFPIAVYSSPIVQNGTAIGIRGTIVDLSDRIQAEKDIRESAMKYRTIFETMGTAGLLIEKDTTISLVNSEFVRWSGYSREEIEHKMKWTVFVVPEDLTRMLEQHRLRRETETGAMHQYEFRFISRSGEVRDVFITLDLIPGTTTSIGSLMDITDRKRAEASTLQSLQEKEVLLKEIHHRVKNNLQSVWGLIELQIQSLSDQTTINTLRDSQNRIRAMALIHETLYRSHDLSHIDFSIYLKSLVTTIMSTYAISAGRIAVQMEIEETQMDVDSGIACGLIVNEMLSNTLKHAFPGDRKGEIKIVFRREGDEFILQFSDNGVGIPADFDPETATSLGLRLVYILACDQLDGDLKLVRGDGTTFVIRFPKR